MVVGAWAVFVHGWPRSSSDIDFVVNVPFAERAPVVELLRKMGNEKLEERKDEWGERVVAQVADALELEVFFTPPRPPYSDEFQRRVVIDVEGEPVPFLAPEDLILRKLVNTKLRRGIDLDDVVGILSVQRGRIDIDRLRSRAALYRVEHVLDRAVGDAEALER